MAFGISPNVLAISPAQMLAAQDRQRQMAQNYELSMRRLNLMQQQIARAGRGRATRMPTMAERSQAWRQQQLERQTIDRQLQREQAARNEAASRAYYGEPELTQRDILGTITKAQAQGVEAVWTPDKGFKYAPAKRGKEFIGEPPEGYEVGYDKLGNRILVRKKEEKPAGIEALSVSALSGIVRNPDKYTPEIVEKAKAEFYRKLEIEQDKPDDTDEKKKSKLRRVLKWVFGIDYEPKVTEELPALQQRVAPTPPAQEIVLNPKTGRYEYGVAPEGRTNRIRVRMKSTGQTGTIELKEFDPNIYERLD